MESNFLLTEKQAEFIRKANHRWNVACGAVRSGKSYLQISYLIPSRLLERKERRGLRVFLGATRANIERNILQPLRDLYGNSAATEINSKNYANVFGVKTYCIGADNVRQVSKLRGSEIAYCAIDEATDINEEVFAMLKSRLSLPYSCCDITTNPSSPNHYFKKFLDSVDDGVDIYLQNYTIYDNPFLPTEYVKALEAEYAGSVWFDRYIRGMWTLAEGLIFANFSQALHSKDFEGGADEYVISLDYGTSNPFAALLWEKHGGIWYAQNELYYSGRDTGKQKTDGEYLKMLEEFAGEVIKRLEVKSEQQKKMGVLIPYGLEIPVIVDPSAASFIAELRTSKWFSVIPANNAVVDGIRETNTAIQNDLIKVHTRCEKWKEEAQSYVWDTDAEEDRPVKEHDHLMDSMRYFVKTKRVVSALNSYKSILERR